MSRTAVQIEQDRARWRRAKARQRARLRGENITAPASSTRPSRGPATPVLRVSGNHGTAWRSASVCGDKDPTIFDGETPEDVEKAQRICRGCPVRSECLAFAVECGTGYGVWGGVHLGAVSVAVAS